MIIYIDENLPPQFARGFHILQEPENSKAGISIEVKAIKDAFGEAVEDEEWIPKAGEQKACAITQDFNIYRNKHQRELYLNHGLGIFFFKPVKGTKYWQKLEMIVKYWPEICKIALRETKPFAYDIKHRGGVQKLE